MSPIQLAVIPDEWTGLPAFVPGRPPDDTVPIRLQGGCELIIPASMAMRLLAGTAGEAARKIADFTEMARRGLLDPAVPAGADAYGNRYYPVQVAIAEGSSYRFASGGLVVQ